MLKGASAFKLGRGCFRLGNDIDVGPLVVLTALTGGKLSKLILKFNFLFIPRQGNRTKLTKLDVEHPEGGL
jgi:hypothetical protein